jgi:DNA helicase HerA-like ATPase
MHGIKIVQQLFKRRLKRATTSYLKNLSDGSQRHQAQLSQALASVTDIHKTAVSFGTTQWGQRVQLPLDKVTAHALVLGASGAGKSFFALSLLNQLLESFAASSSLSLGFLDPKGELFEKAIQYLSAHLYRLRSAEREAFKKRVVIIDFSNAELITPYNILTQREYMADELMVAGRIDTISEQFSGLSEMSVRMKMILKYFFLLLAEFDLPLSFFERLCIDPLLLNALVERSRNPQLKVSVDPNLAEIQP